MKRGRKTLLTAAMRERIIEMLERGHTIKITAGALGFSERVYFEWCQKDSAFAAASLRARATGRMQLVDSILADKDWRARAWYLERCYPEEFGRSEMRVIERPVTGKDGEPLPQDGSAAPVQLIVNVVRDENDPVRRLFGDKPEPANNLRGDD
jgi:hypothetical protein